MLTSQAAIKRLNLHKQADFVNSPHKGINTRNDVIRLLLVVSHILINLHASLKLSYRAKAQKKSKKNKKKNIAPSLNRASLRQYEQCGCEKRPVTNRLSTVFEWIMC